MFETHIKVVDGFGHVELVDGVNNDGGSGQEGKQEEKERIY